MMSGVVVIDKIAGSWPVPRCAAATGGQGDVGARTGIDQKAARSSSAATRA
jgi:hypothetical protein